MKKSTGVLSAVVVAAVAYVGTTWYVGKQAQESIEQSVAQANERMTRAMATQPSVQRARLSVTQYDRHTFSSDVIYSLQLTDEAGESHEFLFNDQLQHGPFPLRAIAAGKLTPMLAFSEARLLPSASTQAWFDSLDGQTPAEGVTQVNFGGSARSDWVLKPLEITANGETMRFSGGTAQARFDNNFADNRFDAHFQLLDYSTSSGNERMAIDDLRFNYVTIASADATRMSASAQAARLAFQASGVESITLQDVSMQASSEQGPELASGAVLYDSGQVLSGDKRLGSVSLGVTARDISMSALTKLASFYDALSARHGPDNENWELSSEEAVELQQHLLALLEADPVLTFEPVAWQNEQGESRLKLVAELTRPEQSEHAMSVDAVLQQMLRSLDLELHLDKPMFVETLVRLQSGQEESDAQAQAAALYDDYVNRLSAAGFVSVGDDAATAKIVYRDERVDANGKSMSVPEFMQRALLTFLM